LVPSSRQPDLWALLKPLIGGRIHVQTVREHWDEVARLIASLRQGTVPPSLLVSKLAGHPRQNHLLVALREIGRIERSCSPGPGYQIRNCAAELPPGSTRAKPITR
jgi:TnpA family transposase